MNPVPSLIVIIRNITVQPYAAKPHVYRLAALNGNTSPPAASSFLNSQPRT